MYAPVLILTLCRYEHFKNCLDSLNKNTGAEYTDVFVALDYPAQPEHQIGYYKISEYLEKTPFRFKSLNVIKREINYGVDRNFEDLKEYVFKRGYDRFIVSEDDNFFSSCFLQYINSGLEATKDMDNVLAVCGYTYPTNFDDMPGKAIAEKSFFSAWGYGIFFDKYFELKKNVSKEYFEKLKDNHEKVNKLKTEFKMNYSYYVGSLWKRDFAFDDIRISIYMNCEGLYIVMPKLSMVRNEGWDGSGIHCKNKTNIDYGTQRILNSLTYQIDDSEEILFSKIIDTRLNTLFAPNYKTRIKTTIKEHLLELMGRL